MIETVWIILLLPFVSFLINGLLGSRFKKLQVGLVACTAMGAAFVLALLVLSDLLTLPPGQRSIAVPLYTWIDTGAVHIDVSFLIDPLSTVMMLVVTGVGLLIHIYSIGYMAGDDGFARYFSFLSLFSFAMLLLVLADNYLLMFVGWEGVGLCSYLLIGFWYEDENNAYAGRKAFIVNRVGDFGFLLGIILMFAIFGTVRFNSLFEAAPDVLSTGMATLIGLLLFLGATGKSAQIPLYIWLPDAMAGPTPVSALIHAATMVTAGVYMVARSHVIYQASEVAMNVIAVIGIVTAFLAATIALVSDDIKKVLAYSTISQLGYMFLACGVGAFSAGIFHVTTHAYFKALLFLSAGSVMHALGNETRMSKMGGLRMRLPVTYRVFLVGAMALAGVPFLSGFFSKDEILWKTVSSTRYGSFALWVAGALVAGLTAFYAFRLIFLVFHGRSRVSPEMSSDIHESPRIMTVPLTILAFLSIIGGWIGIPHFFNLFEHFLQPVFPGAGQPPDLLDLEIAFAAVSSAIALIGIGFAYLLYVAKPDLPGLLVQKLRYVYLFLSNKWYVDDLYDLLVVRPIAVASEKALWRWLDVGIIDGTANRIASFFRDASSWIRRTQTGFVQNYALSVAVGLILLIGYFLLK